MSEPALASPPDFKLAQVEELEGALLAGPQLEAPLVHHFAPGVYLREATLPAGACVIGHCHKTDHYNIILTGSALVFMGGEHVETIRAPAIFKAPAGVRKVLKVIEEMRWVNVHPATTTDLTTLESELITHSPTFDAHMKTLTNPGAAPAALAEAVGATP